MCRPGVTVSCCSVSIRRGSRAVHSIIKVRKATLTTSRMFVFYLGPKLEIRRMGSKRGSLGFGQRRRVLTISFKERVRGNSAVSFSIDCRKEVGSSFYCLSVPRRILRRPCSGRVLGLSGGCDFRASSCILFAPRAC